MGATLSTVVADACSAFEARPDRLLDVLLAVDERLGGLDPEAVDEVAAATGARRVDVESLVAFYSFLTPETRGRVVLRICDDVVDVLKGAHGVLRSLEDELGITVGETTPDGLFTLETASCIGLSDQAPGALIGGVPVPGLGPAHARRLVREIRALRAEGELGRLHSILVEDWGDGNNAHDLVRVGVRNNVRRAGAVHFAEMEPGAALWKALSMSPVEVIREIKASRLRGRGGAGFPAGMKWEFTRAAPGDRKVLICNADEGEPGTFKDRVLLTERPDLVFEGMTIAGYAIGAREGILYLRAEYAYLRPFLEDCLARRRDAGLLGTDLCSSHCHDFDIRIQMGAGAYVCGEETALIDSCEGRPGVPRSRPPFPAQEGYLGLPTSVNNVETLCCAARIVEKGSGWFASMGTIPSSGTKLLSVSGDCRRPGIYEVEFGIPLREVLDLCGAEEPRAVQVGGPSGRLVGRDAFSRTICFDDLATGGALIVFGEGRDLVDVVRRYTRFFAHESCGFCTPCRVGTRLLGEGLDALVDGRADAADLRRLKELGATVRATSRCGLGTTAPRPLLTALEAFPDDFRERLAEPVDSLRPSFDLEASLAESRRLRGGSPLPSARSTT